MSKGSGIIVALVIIVLIGFGAWVFLWDGVSEVNDVATNEEEVTGETDVGEADETDEVDPEVDHEVVHDGSGFNPESLTINTGETVGFVNESNDAIWPASDVHPQHAELPEFDAERSIEPGETYTHTFEEEGEWGYHNHRNPSITGTIIVE